ncbi:hypothetical protein V8E55_008812 [Tylopilus felleus]
MRSTTASSIIIPTVSSLRQPQTLPRSPLTSVQNIVATWKERIPALGKAQSSTKSRSSQVNRNQQQPTSEDTGSGHQPPTPKSVTSNVIPPPLNMTELGAYARETRETIPSEKSTPRLLVVELPIENAPTPPKAPTEVVSLQSPKLDVHPEITDIIREARPLPPSEFSPTMSSVGQEIKVEHLEVTAPPSGIVSSETSLVLTVSTTESSEFVMGDLPLLPTPLMQLREFQEGRDTSFESSPLCPSVSPTSMGSLTAMTETITTSIASTPLLLPSAPLPPPPAPVTQSVSSLSSGRDLEFVGSGSIGLHHDIAEPFSAWISYGLHRNYSHHDKYH